MEFSIPFLPEELRTTSTTERVMTAVTAPPAVINKENKTFSQLNRKDSPQLDEDKHRKGFKRHKAMSEVTDGDAAAVAPSESPSSFITAEALERVSNITRVILERVKAGTEFEIESILPFLIQQQQSTNSSSSSSSSNNSISGSISSNNNNNSNGQTPFTSSEISHALTLLEGIGIMQKKSETRYFRAGDIVAVSSKKESPLSSSSSLPPQFDYVNLPLPSPIKGEDPASIVATRFVQGHLKHAIPFAAPTVERMKLYQTRALNEFIQRYENFYAKAVVKNGNPQKAKTSSGAM